MTESCGCPDGAPWHKAPDSVTGFDVTLVNGEPLTVAKYENGPTVCLLCGQIRSESPTAEEAPNANNRE